MGSRCTGWFLSSPTPARFTVVVFSGNAGNRAYRAPLARAFDRGLAVLLFDYRGYGDNDGSPTETGLAVDARAAGAYLAARADVDPTRLVYFGESLGAAVAVTLAVEHPPAALVLRSPFSSLSAVGRVHYPFLPVTWLLRDRFASLDRIAEVKCPVLIIAGERDSIIPPEQSRQLYDAVTRRKRRSSWCAAPITTTRAGRGAGSHRRDRSAIAGAVITPELAQGPADILARRP